MSLTAQNLLPNPNLNPNLRLSLHPTTNHPLHIPFKTHNFSVSLTPRTQSILSDPLSHHSNRGALHTHRWPVRALDSDLSSQEHVDGVNFDVILLVLEFLCIGFSAVVSLGLCLNKSIFGQFGNRVLGLQVLGLVGAVAIGATIRGRQWRRVSGFRRRGGGEKVNLVERIEKLEEDVRTSATIVRVLSRQLEKLGVRFRVTRRTLKDPIAEAAALAQKNSEATRVLAAQEDILEKELSEIQKVLLAMQDQQQKQLELILAVAKAGNLWNTRQGPTREKEQEALETRKSDDGRPNPIVTTHTRALDSQKEANNDKA